MACLTLSNLPEEGDVSHGREGKRYKKWKNQAKKTERVKGKMKSVGFHMILESIKKNKKTRSCDPQHISLLQL